MKAASLTIAPVGTCRIHTPLRKGRERYPVKAELGRNYGFVHTSSEALQQLRFMLLDQLIPEGVQRLTFRPGLTAGIYGRPHTPAGLYLVEVSSRKLLSVDGYPIQINYMGRYFSDFFADRRRTRRFWSMASMEKLSERRAWLDSDAEFIRLSPADRDLLAQIVRREQSTEELGREMREIAGLVGKDKLVFITHINAITPDNKVIEQRHRLIETVSSIAQCMGVPCYDPTTLMREVGQVNALEEDGIDLTHYTDSFSEKLFADWYVRFIGPRIVSAGAGSADMDEPPVMQKLDTAEGIEAAWDAGQIREASQRVHAVLRAHPNSLVHRVLLARMQFELGDFESVIASLELARNDGGLNERAEQWLMRANFAIGEYGEAGRVAAALLGDEIETPEILRISAESAAKLGDVETALAGWKRLFRLSENPPGAATAALDLLTSTADLDGASRWADEVRDALPSHAPSYCVQWEARLRSRDRAALIALAVTTISLDEHVALDLAQRASSQGYAFAAATLCVTHNLLRDKAAHASKWLVSQAARWLSDGLAALQNDDLLVAADCIQASAQVMPAAAQTVRAKRLLELRLRQAARLALTAKSYQEVVSIAVTALATGCPFPELDSFLGRASDALGDTETAMRHLRRAADAQDATLSTRIFLARAAARCGRYQETQEAYSMLAIDHNVDQATRDEAQRQLRLSRNRAIRAAREMLADGEHENAWKLFDLIEKTKDDSSDIGQEKRRVLISLYAKLRTLDVDGASERMTIGETILRLAPGDPVGLKVAASAAMRLQRFAHALPYWYALREKAINVEQIEGSIRKCLTYIERAKDVNEADSALAPAV
ncbi:hypothetical protein [Caballeronia glebae]|uniref:hypothetical protein n=1 Tax=Caballeronia glebae TaxID=1777143 RepID=UPI0038BDBD70